MVIMFVGLQEFWAAGHGSVFMRLGPVQNLGEPCDYAGVQALDEGSYKSTMKKDHAYLCNVAVSAFDVLGFAHPSIPPNMGSVRLMQQNLSSPTDTSFMVSGVYTPARL